MVESVKRGASGRLATALGLGILAGVLTGAVVTAYQLVPTLAGTGAVSAARARAAVVALPVHVAACALLGVAFSVLAAALSRPASMARNWLDLGRFSTRDPSASREPVIAVHATLAAAILALGVVGGSMSVAVVQLRRIQIPATAETFTIASGVVAAACGALAFVVARAVLSGVFRRLDARFTLPRPASADVRAASLAALPVAVACYATLAGASPLGPVELPLRLLAIASTWAFFRLMASRARAIHLRATRAASAAGVLAAGVCFGVGARLPDGDAASTLARTGFGELSLGLLRSLTDVDRDGASALFAGGDCAPMNREISPRTREIPGNSVDENCDGRAPLGVAGEVEQGPRFFQALDPALVARRNVVWFVVDAVRADHVSALGYEKRTTPYLERLAPEALVFERALSQSSSTMLSIPSMMTGIDPGRMQWVFDHHRAQPADRDLLVAERLRAEGYRTGITGSYYFQKNLPGLLRGYDEVMVGSQDQRESTTDSAALSVKFIERALASDQPFFLTVYLVAPHVPYVTHAEGYPDFGDSETSVYDGEIAYADRHIGFILDVLKVDRRLWDDTIVVVTSDHGEEFKEHGAISHANSCFIESVHVPLFVRIPGVKGKRVSGRVALVDVLPTLIELLGLSRADLGRLDGRSLIGTAFEPEGAGSERPVTCTIVQQSGTGLRGHRRALRLGRWTLYQDLIGARSTSLFDTQADPGELAPLELAGESAALAGELASALDAAMIGNIGELDFFGD